MNILTVTTKQLTYPIYFDKSYDFLKQAVAYSGLSANRAVVIVDSNIAELYLDTVKKCLSDIFTDVSSFTFAAGENSKNLNTVRDIYAFFVEQKLDRKSVIFALGGGVTGDIAGFAAATFMRGIPYAQLPTSLLAQVDSGVGGKVGVDFLGQKNFIGAFYQPIFVYVNTETLKTLPNEQYTSGLGECIKHGLIRDADYYAFIKEHIPEINGRQSFAITKLIEDSCRIKADIVQKDEREDNIRKLLNFGHTFGHAIESLSGFTLLHGHGVAYGMRGALYLSHKIGNIDKNTLDEYDSLLKAFNFPALELDYDTPAIYRQMFSDKKAEDGRLGLIVLEKPGIAYVEQNFTEEQVISAIKYIIKGF